MPVLKYLLEHLSTEQLTAGHDLLGSRSGVYAKDCEMTLPRSSQVSLETTPYYHCISRCVRKSFLCGEDRDSGVSYEHRRQWIEDNLLFLSQVFTIEICAYSILHNHYHATLHINVEKALALTDEEVIKRWHQLYRGTDLSRKFSRDEILTNSEIAQLEQLCNTWRERLYSVSWFMRCSNEPIARRANKEDDCTGHFWEGRYKCKPILDYKALMATMVYNELNPLKAGIADDIPTSKYTSIVKRMRQSCNPEEKATGLMPFSGDRTIADNQSVLPFTLKDYITAVYWSANNYLEKTSRITPFECPNLVNSLGMTSRQWSDAVLQFDNFSGIVGTCENIREFCQRVNREWMHGIKKCEQCFGTQDQENNPLMSMMLARAPRTQI